MSIYVVYDATGVVHEYKRQDVSPDVPEGFSVLEVAEVTTAHSVVLDGELQPLPAQPTKYHTWDNGWILPPSALDQAKLDKRVEVNYARAGANTSTFNHAGKVFAADKLARSDIDCVNGWVALTGALPPGWVGAWKAVDNTFLPISTVSEWTAFYAAMLNTGSANYIKAQQLKQAIEAASTVQEVLDVHW